MSIDKILESYRAIEFRCSSCSQIETRSPPIDLLALRCSHCNLDLDPIQKTSGGLVNHLLMFRLIMLCYKHVAFSREILGIYKTNPRRCEDEEFGIDRRLLMLHAAQAVILNGHRNLFLLPVLFLLILASLVLGTGVLLLGAWFIVVYLHFAHIRREQHKRNNFMVTRYDPSSILKKNHPLIERIINVDNINIPGNLFFCTGYDPFRTAGHSDGYWTLLIDRRRKTFGENTSAPVSMDASQLYSELTDAVIGICGDGIRPSRFWVTDVVLVDSRTLRPGSIFLDEKLHPRTSLTESEIAQIKYNSDDRFRYYKQITFYDPWKDTALRIYLRILDQSPFTYIETVGVRLLPTIEKIFGRYSHRATSSELELESSFFHKLSSNGIIGALTNTFRHLIALTLLCLIPYAIPYWERLLGKNPLSLLSSWPTLVQILASNSRTAILPVVGYLVLLLFSSQITFPRSKAYDKITDDKKFKREVQALEFDYNSTHWSIRYGQGRAQPVSYFERSTLDMIRRLFDETLIDAFLHYFEKLGIDTSEYRKGIMMINNFGIINSGSIAGAINNTQLRGDGSVASAIRRS